MKSNTLQGRKINKRAITKIATEKSIEIAISYLISLIVMVITMGVRS